MFNTGKVLILTEVQGKRATSAGVDPSNALFWKQVLSSLLRNRGNNKVVETNAVPYLCSKEGGKVKEALRKLYKLTKASRVRGCLDLQNNFF